MSAGLERVERWSGDIAKYGRRQVFKDGMDWHDFRSEDQCGTIG